MKCKKAQSQAVAQSFLLQWKNGLLGPDDGLVLDQALLHSLNPRMGDSNQNLTSDEIGLIDKFLRFANQKFELHKYGNANVEAIQRAWKCSTATILVSRLKHSTALLQRTSRKFTAVHSLTKAEKAANQIQHAFKNLKNGAMKTSAVTLIQRVCRGYLTSQKALQARNSILTIQKAFRACATCKQQIAVLRAALAIQNHFCAYYRDIGHLRRMESALKVIQRRVRGEKAGASPTEHQEGKIKQPPQILRKHGDAFLQQSFSQHENAACKLLQRAYRKRFQVGGYITAKIVKMQSLVRGLLARKAKIADELASCAIQRCWRQGRCVAAEAGAIRLQRLLKAPLAVVQVSRKKQAIGVIQSRARLLGLGRFLKSKQIAALAIQAAVRQANVQKAMLQEKAAAQRIQQHYRKIIARRQYRTRYNAAVCVQKHWRSAALHARMIDERRGAMQLQALFRSKSKALYKEKVGLFVAALAATVIQRSARYFKVKATAVECENAALTIQKHARAFLVMQNVCLQRRAATILQTQYRRESPKDIQELHKWLLATVQIQQSVRLFAFGCAFRKIGQASVKIQTYYRVFAFTKTLRRKAAASAAIAAIFRRTAYKRRQETELRAALIIQKACNLQLKARRVAFSVEKIQTALIERYELNNPVATQAAQ